MFESVAAHSQISLKVLIIRSDGPEIDIEHWVQDKTFITAMPEYQFLVKSGSDARDRYDHGSFFYSVGVGYNY